jgi:hypothetical protein
MRPTARSLLAAVVLGTVIAAIPMPASTTSVPRTLAAVRHLGDVDGQDPVIDPAFPLDYLGVSWRSGSEPRVRFQIAAAWTGWSRVHEDELPSKDGRAWSTLVPAYDADAYQVRGAARGVRAHAINTTDGPRSLTWEQPAAEATHLAQPAVISRQGWGADESYRFDAQGNEIWPPAFFPTRKLIVHHTATANSDPYPAATVRAIYRYHAVDRGYGDIGYNFLVDAQGNVYKGRYSGPGGTVSQDTLSGENAEGLGVTAAHTGGWNSGTMGIAVLGDFRTAAVPADATQTLVDHLAWESERHGIDPAATSTFTNPVSGEQKTTPNISGHRDWVATACPGGTLYDALPDVRQDVAAMVQGSTPPPDTRAPVISGVAASSVTRTAATITWSTDEPADSRVEYWPARSPTHTWTLPESTPVTSHRVALTGLKPRTRYDYRVHSADAAGNEAVGGILSFRTRR